MEKKAVLFDIDGTLVDSNDYHVTVWQEAFAAVGARFSAEAIHAQIGKGADMFIPSLMPDADEETHVRLEQLHGDIFKRRHLAQTKPFDGAHELLARVHGSGRRVVLASSASQEELEHYLDLLDARALVSATTSGDDVERTKPAPDIFATALGKLPPLTASEVLVVGDSPWDFEAAARCGIAAVGLRSGKFPEHALKQAAVVYDDVAALLADFDNSPLAR
jgi:HAD superfamily hydrolase (TIGR01509 family)